MKDGVTIIGTVVAVIALVILLPIIYLFSGWFVGWVIEAMTGSYVTSGLNLLFGTDRFAEGDLPKITATLAVVGSFFKAQQTNKNNG
jgi:hypothetical protein